MNAAQAEPSRPRIRPSRSGRRRAFVLGGVHLLLFAHLLHWWWSGRTLTPLEPSEGMEFSKQGVVNAGLLFFAAAGLSTLVFGRYFCGWACHLVALQDLCRWMLLKVGIRPKPLRSRALLWVPAGAFLYMFVWPLLYRSWVGDDLGVRAVHLTTTSFWATFPGPIVAVVTFLVCGFAAVYFLGAKGFCTYACPYGALFGAVDRFAPGRIRVTDACEGCGHCTAVCSSNVVVHAEVRDFGMVVDPGCMKCMDCVSVCPNDALYFGFGRPAAFAAPRVAVPSVRKAEHGWREEAALGALFLLAFTAFRGLYGVVPFLLALGLGAIVACLALQALRMIYRRDVRLARWVLKSGGRLRPAGRCFAVGMLLFAGAWVHSGLVRWHGFERHRLAAHAGDPAAVERALQHAAFVTRWGLLRDLDNELESARLHRAAGRADAYEAGLRAVLAGAPERAFLHFELAEHLALQGRNAESAERFEFALALPEVDRIDPHRRSAAHFQIGVAAALADDLDAAAAAFGAALAGDPDSVPIRENLAATLGRLAEGLLEAGRPEEARKKAAAALELDPGEARAAAVLSRVSLGFGPEPPPARSHD